MIREIAPAKINLALHVRRRRDDGYHDIETLFAFARDGDVVRVAVAQAEAEAGSLVITGPFAAGLTATGDNLVARAARAFADSFGIGDGHAITLEKHLPVASGVGGGSADAAATLRALARLHAIPLIDPRLHIIAAALGADVPACLLGRTTLGTGKGDALVEIMGAPGTPLLLVNPLVPVSTAAVFAAWDGKDRGPIPDGALLDRARAGRNDLEPSATTLAPVIADVRAMLNDSPGVTLARMSGSGATCFALFDTIGEREAAAVLAQRRGWWTLGTSLA
ncbi:4-(cytidine 5'-diphospho)-2-C-methyl-D-erythritol kinase [Sphingomonas oligophenolica]|uniref:4-diphosphocytidyl-2-C-methyl-D-erythritol kinase n=1 Tax=Sphingomonas oligophenolica TaxID=301154 RepID=A0A502CIP2_9SPHN|nr:4-(cytidine 5'-diphospho)-2-C-methyl-D-erythritol kinase [Sphingomonas oligophenolica]TPG12484.1 4-(cytidine 5'-diphospho)-2-C-methyl-D-erythritol kinase [Sphingomonas oligophenolica]